MISLKRLEGFSRRVGLSLGAGLDLLSTLERESASLPPVRQVAEAIRIGETFAAGLRRTGNFFPPMFIVLVEVAEESGMLVEGMQELADDYANTLQRRREFLNSLFLPLCELGIAIVIIGILILVLGWVQQMTNMNIDPLGLGLVGVRGLVVYLAVLSGIGIAGYFVFQSFSTGSHRSAIVQRLFAQIPLVGKLLQTLALARLMRSLFMTLRTGMDVRAALTIAYDSVAFAPVSGGRDAALNSIANGGTIAEALAPLGWFDHTIPSQLVVGEESGNTPEICDRLSKQFMTDATFQMRRLSVVGFFLIYGLVAAVIIFFIFRLAMFYIGTINDALAPM
ncbi:MAG: type II secretion system F family protein [Thermoguttaceae bacterium]